LNIFFIDARVATPKKTNRWNGDVSKVREKKKKHTKQGVPRHGLFKLEAFRASLSKLGSGDLESEKHNGKTAATNLVFF